MSTMRVLVTGSRHWTDSATIHRELVALREQARGIAVVVAHGKSRGGGADLLVDAVARRLGLEVWPCPVDPELDGRHRGAPLNRNVRMLDSFRPDLVLAFRASGKSSGTDHCVREARKRGIPITICTPGTVTREIGAGPMGRGLKP